MRADFFAYMIYLEGPEFLNTTLLLNEVSEIRREIWNEDSEKFAEIYPEIRPDIFGAFLAGRKVLPQISQKFHIRDFKFQIKFHQKTPQRTSAGMAALKISRLCNAYFYLKYSGASKYGTMLGNSLPVGPAQQTNNRKLPKIFGLSTMKEYVMHNSCIKYPQEYFK